jgi:hypothetical protein
MYSYQRAMIYIYIDRASISAAPSLALLSSVGSGRWNQHTGKHGTLQGKQLSTPSASGAHNIHLITFGFVRYIYIPLGGMHRLAETNILTFTFVALWHDLSLRLLACG